MESNQQNPEEEDPNASYQNGEYVTRKVIYVQSQPGQDENIKYDDHQVKYLKPIEINSEEDLQKLLSGGGLTLPVQYVYENTEDDPNNPNENNQTPENLQNFQNEKIQVQYVQVPAEQAQQVQYVQYVKSDEQDPNNQQQQIQYVRAEEQDDSNQQQQQVQYARGDDDERDNNQQQQQIQSAREDDEDDNQQQVQYLREDSQKQQIQYIRANNNINQPQQIQYIRQENQQDLNQQPNYTKSNSKNLNQQPRQIHYIRPDIQQDQNQQIQHRQQQVNQQPINRQPLPQQQLNRPSLNQQQIVKQPIIRPPIIQEINPQQINPQQINQQQLTQQQISQRQVTQQQIPQRPVTQQQQIPQHPITQQQIPQRPIPQQQMPQLPIPQKQMPQQPINRQPILQQQIPQQQLINHQPISQRQMIQQPIPQQQILTQQQQIQNQELLLRQQQELLQQQRLQQINQIPQTPQISYVQTVGESSVSSNTSHFQQVNPSINSLNIPTTISYVYPLEKKIINPVQPFARQQSEQITAPQNQIRPLEQLQNPSLQQIPFRYNNRTAEQQFASKRLYETNTVDAKPKFQQKQFLNMDVNYQEQPDTNRYQTNNINNNRRVFQRQKSESDMQFTRHISDNINFVPHQIPENKFNLQSEDEDVQVYQGESDAGVYPNQNNLLNQNQYQNYRNVQQPIKSNVKRSYSDGKLPTINSFAHGQESFAKVFKIGGAPEENIYQQPQPHYLNNINNYQNINNNYNPNINNNFENDYNNTLEILATKIQRKWRSHYLLKSFNMIRPQLKAQCDNFLRLQYALCDEGGQIMDDDFEPNGWMKFYQPDDQFFNYDKGYVIPNGIKVTHPNDPINVTVYEGDVNLQNEKHGFGRLTTPNSVYLGNWKHDSFTGWGRETKRSGKILEGKYINGLVEGKGILRNSKGNSYIGDFVKSKRHGKGILETHKIHYEGDFVDDKLSGRGTIVFKNEGHTYEGQFNNNEINGFGTFKWCNGDYYTGEMLNGKMHGRGRYTYRNGHVFEGVYNNGIKQEGGRMYQNRP